MKSIKAFLLIAALFIYGLATLATCVAVWACESIPTYAHVTAGIVLALNAYVIYRKAKAYGKMFRDNGGLK